MPWMRPVLEPYADEIQQKIYAGQSASSIALEYGVDKWTASNFIKRHLDYPEELKQRNIAKAKDQNKNSEADVREKIHKANPDLEYVRGYTRKEDPVVVKCLACLKEFEVTFHSIVHRGGGRCPHCIAAEQEARKEIIDKQRAERKQKRTEARERRQAEQIAKREARRHNCPVCGTETFRLAYCSKKCSRKADNKRRDIKRRIKIRNAMVDKDITLEGLYRRDNGVCYICGIHCNYEDYTVVNGTVICGNWYPSIDHVQPLVKDGAHSWENVKLAHRICNSHKRSQGTGRNW